MTGSSGSRADQGETAASRDEGQPTDSPRKGELHRRAVEILRKMVLSGDLAPGERLREVALSQQLGMSRTPIREAFRTLAAEGLVDLMPNRSVLVSELDEVEAAEVFTVLGALEALAGRLACERMTPQQIEILGELQQDLVRHFNNADRAGYAEANRLIHAHIVEASNSPSLIMAWRLLLPRAERARRVSTLNHERWAEAFQEHCDIYDALAERDAGRIQRLMDDHFLNGIESLKKSEGAARAAERSQAYAAAR